MIFNKFILRISYLCLPAVVLVSCSSEPVQVTARDSSNISSNAPALKPFEPDPGFVLAKEAVSQYGPAGIVRDVVIDHNGTIWLAAWDGVVSYDGKEFTNHTVKDGLSHHRVYSVMEDSKGSVWFGTLGAGAYKYDGVTFTNYSTNNGMAGNTVVDLFEDHTGKIWFATDSGVNCYDGQVFMNIDRDAGLTGNAQAISEDRTGTIWIGTSEGLFTYHENQVRELMTEYDTHYSNVRDLYCDHSGVMYIAAARGLYMCNAPGSQNEIAQVNDKFTGYVCEDDNGNLLLTSDGLFRFDGAKTETIVGDKNNLGIFGAREDKNGITWYGAMDGLHKCDGHTDITFFKP